jgi:hypothetical protein
MRLLVLVSLLSVVSANLSPPGFAKAEKAVSESSSSGDQTVNKESLLKTIQLNGLGLGGSTPDRSTSLNVL